MVLTQIPNKKRKTMAEESKPREPIFQSREILREERRKEKSNERREK
jgi:hypothetical protein